MIDNLRDIRRIYHLHDILARVGKHPRKQWMVCPLPEHVHSKNTPSFSMWTTRDGTERWMCHGMCGRRGDSIDLAGYLFIPFYSPDDPKMVLEAVGILRADVNITFPTPKTKPAKLLHPLQWKKYLPMRESGYMYMRNRGLTDETMGRFKLGQSHMHVTIPAFQEHRLMGIKKRAIDDLRIRYIMETGSKMSLFNYDEVAYRDGVTFIVKGEITCMILAQLGYQACAPSAGEGLNKWRDAWTHVLGFAKLVVIGDNDNTGVKTARHISEKIGALLRFPPTCKDWDEYWLEKPMTALNLLRDWHWEAERWDRIGNS